MRVGIEKLYGIHPCVEDEQPPRSVLLSLFLSDADHNEDFYLAEIAKAAAGEPNVVIGNHAVWALMSTDKVTLEQMLPGEQQVDGTQPLRTEISLGEAKQLILDWLEAKRQWHAEHHLTAAATACALPGSK
ncbi:MAG TPA: hypothetical protein PLW65_15950 [Pseudomonadota bacterium]|nr:hypothetical protein [Pseudomonadota bacterium]